MNKGFKVYVEYFWYGLLISVFVGYLEYLIVGELSYFTAFWCILLPFLWSISFGDEKLEKEDDK